VLLHVLLLNNKKNYKTNEDGLTGDVLTIVQVHNRRLCIQMFRPNICCL